MLRTEDDIVESDQKDQAKRGQQYQAIREFLRDHVSEPRAIAHARVAWAIASGKCRSQRMISELSGVSLPLVNQILPEYGQEDEYGLIKCSYKGRASLDPGEVKRGYYKVITGAQEAGPDLNTALSSTYTPLPSPLEDEDHKKDEDHQKSSVQFWTAPQVPEVTLLHLDPCLDIWKKAGQWLWALAVVSGCSDDLRTTTSELASWSGMTSSAVRKLLRKWDTGALNADESIGLVSRKGDQAVIWFSFLLDETVYLDREISKQHGERHNAERKRHRQRMTPEGLQAWQLRQSVGGTKEDEDAMYATLVAQAEGEAVSKPESDREAVVVTQVPVAPVRPSVSRGQDEQRTAEIAADMERHEQGKRPVLCTKG